MAKYRWRSEQTKMLRMLRASQANKIKHNWSREAGAGFIVDDIQKMELIKLDKEILMLFSWGKQSFRAVELNLRETEEAIKFLELKAVL